MAITRLNNNSITSITALPSGVATGSFFKLHQIIASAGDSTVIFDNTYINTDYDVYRFYLKNVLPGTDSVSLRAVFSFDNGSSWYTTSNYTKTLYESHEGTASDITNSRHSTGSGSMQLTGSAATQGSADGEGSEGYIDFFNGTTQYKKLHCFLTYHFNGGQTATSQGVHELKSDRTTRVNAIKFYYSSGNFSSAVFTLYGVKNA